MAHSARRRPRGGTRAAHGRRKQADGTETATMVMTAIRLALTIGDLIRDALRDWPGGPGRLL